ncbi:hypothetical protein, partial [Burkholderia gladioli]|uniref:hypothetical protein n=1 Tax=Burkholderia gladioli TaxID=28095 RepID=UPI002FE18CB8
MSRLIWWGLKIVGGGPLRIVTAWDVRRDRAKRLTDSWGAIASIRLIGCWRRIRFVALTCLISSGHFNLGERPRLLQLNNTAA